jgi:ribosome-associated protein
MDLIVNPVLVIPSNELHWRFSRSSGSGGQNINKTDTRVNLSFNIEKSKALTSYQKHQITKQLSDQIVNATITVITQEHRTQYKNRKLALMRLGILLGKALEPPPKARKTTKPTKSSQRRRVNSKKKHGRKKQSRGRETMIEEF